MNATSEPMRALWSASNLHRRMACAGSARAEEHLPAIQSPFSEEGRLLHHHDAYPDQSREGLTTKQKEILARNEGLRVRFRTANMEQLGIPDDAPSTVIVEQEFFLCDKGGIPLEPPFPGHPDRVEYFAEQKVLFIYDSKFGRRPVEHASINWQLKAYAVMLADNYDVEHAVVCITQPWLSSPEDLHSALFCAEEIGEAKTAILAGIQGAESPTAPRVPSMDSCIYCRALGSQEKCPESKVVLAELAILKVNSMDADQLEAMYPEVQRAEKVIEAIKERMRNLGAHGLLQQYRLGAEQTLRSVADNETAVQRLQYAGLLSSDKEIALLEALTCCRLSIPDLVEMVARTKSITAAAAEEKVMTTLGDVVEKNPKRAPIIKNK